MEIKNLYFSWTTKQFFVFIELYEKKERRKYDFDEAIKSRIDLIARVFRNQNLLDFVSICVRCNDVNSESFKTVCDVVESKNLHCSYAQNRKPFAKPLLINARPEQLHNLLTLAQSLIGECKDDFHFTVDEKGVKSLQENARLLTDSCSGLRGTCFLTPSEIFCVHKACLNQLIRVFTIKMTGFPFPL